MLSARSTLIEVRVFGILFFLPFFHCFRRLMLMISKWVDTSLHFFFSLVFGFGV